MKSCCLLTCFRRRLRHTRSKQIAAPTAAKEPTTMAILADVLRECPAEEPPAEEVEVGWLVLVAASQQDINDRRTCPTCYALCTRCRGDTGSTTCNGARCCETARSRSRGGCSARTLRRQGKCADPGRASCVVDERSCIRGVVASIASRSAEISIEPMHSPPRTRTCCPPRPTTEWSYRADGAVISAFPTPGWHLTCPRCLFLGPTKIPQI